MFNGHPEGAGGGERNAARPNSPADSLRRGRRLGDCGRAGGGSPSEVNVADPAVTEGLDLVRGSNIIDALCSKQLELKDKEADLERRAETLAKEREAFEAEKAAVQKEKDALAESKETAAGERGQLLEHAQKDAESVKSRAIIEATLYAEASKADADLEAKQTTEESDSAAAKKKAELAVEEASLAELRRKLEAEISEARKHDERKAGRVELDVGGVRFSTSVETLTISDSPYFKALFSGAWQRDDAQPIFIDRDPAIFTVILRYLRYACKPEFLTSALAGMTEEERWALLVETEYFQLAQAAELIGATAAGANPDLHSLAQIVGKRLKVTQTFGSSSYHRNLFHVEAVST